MVRLLAAILLLGCTALAQDTIAITGVTIVDGTARPEVRGTVVIRAGRIAAAGPEAAAPAGARIIPGEGLTVLPGLFDLHTHLLASPGEGQPADWGKTLKAYLYAGVTSVADMSTFGEQIEPMRRLVAGGLAAPRLAMAVRFSSPGGHGAEGGRGDFHTQTVQTPAEARAALARILPYKPDLIKIFTDGWRYGTGTDMTSMNQETLSALVEEGHRHGLRSFTHTVTVDKAKLAVRAGADAIIHGLGDAPVDEELAALARGGKTAYVPTLAVYETHVFPDGPPPLLAEMLPAAAAAKLPKSLNSIEARRRRWANLTSNVKALARAGMAVGCGTDAGMTYTFHGYAAQRETQLLVAAGLSPLEAIAAATGTAARILGVDSSRGVIRPGLAADLLLVEGAPYRNIEDLSHIRAVFLDGKEVDRAGLRQAMLAPDPTPLQARAVPPLLDDFEDAGGRSHIGTLWVNGTDAGHDHSRMSWQRTLRRSGDHALTVLAHMAEKDAPLAAVVLPLSRGAVEPVDLSGYAAIEFDARGDGAYSLLVQRRSTRGRAGTLPFRAAAEWSKVRLPLPERVGDALALQFRIERKADEDAWLELDNIRLVR